MFPKFAVTGRWWRQRLARLNEWNRGVFYFFYFAGIGGARDPRRRDRTRDGTRMHGRIRSQPGGCRKMVSHISLMSAFDPKRTSANSASGSNYSTRMSA